VPCGSVRYCSALQREVRNSSQIYGVTNSLALGVQGDVIALVPTYSYLAPVVDAYLIDGDNNNGVVAVSESSSLTFTSL